MKSARALLVAAALMMLLAAANNPAAAVAAVTGASAQAADVAKGAGVDALAGVGAMQKRDASFRENEVVGDFRMAGWDLFAENTVRSVNTAVRPAQARNKALRDMPVPAVPKNTIPSE